MQLAMFVMPQGSAEHFQAHALPCYTALEKIGDTMGVGIARGLGEGPKR